MIYGSQNRCFICSETYERNRRRFLYYCTESGRRERTRAGESPGKEDKKEESSGGEKGVGKEKKKVSAEGVGVFKENKLIGYLDEDETKGLLWITDKVSGGVLVTESKEVGQISTAVLEVVPKLQFTMEEDVPVCSISMNCFVGADEVQGDENDFTLETLSAVEKEIGDNIKEKIDKSINRCINDFNVDIFRLNDYFRNFNPNLYKQVKDNWHDYIKTIQFKTDVSVQITRVGERVIKRNGNQ